MKVKALIEELLKCDQEAEVNIDGNGIHFVNPLPGYYDGYYEQPTKSDGVHIDGIHFTRAGNKVILESFELDSAFIDCDTLDEMERLKKNFTFDPSLDKSQVRSIEKRIRKAIDKSIEINERVAQFNKQGFKQLTTLQQVEKDHPEEIEKMVEMHLSQEDPKCICQGFHQPPNCPVHRGKK